MSSYDDIMCYLRRNPLKNVTLLKMMTAYHQVMDSYLVEQAEHWGILLLLPADVFAYDRRVYPEADYVVLMDYSNPEVLSDLISRIPADASLVFKLQQEARIAVAPHFPLTQVRSFYSYTTTPGQIFKPDMEAIVNDQIDERLLPLWMENGYTPEEIAQYFEDSAFSVAIYKELTPLSTCIVFRNGEQIWEIGAVHTAEPAGDRGWLSV
ncbi:hypothetical protein [Paenibacillus sp. DMB5]|uniref:hypothetical protein n=1 Tax=Paenibacillus sp. DMB5 TaxID=1780103 RepID=UPI00076D50CF|nr:hypothetical protein [Paenibacillus sp. DMB5]KUP23735.1 hypothetical protein AWJ19_09830 [Paenibacillus sp. DMB5]